MTPDNYIQVLTTTGKKEDAETIARKLIEKKLAGCVQIMGPVVSTYRWQGRIDRSEEWLCFIKTREDLYDELEKEIKSIHPYETPEIIALPVAGGSEDYLKWLNGEVKKKT
jgi:periplasmic divalent cation tolerance protein